MNRRFGDAIHWDEALEKVALPDRHLDAPAEAPGRKTVPKKPGLAKLWRDVAPAALEQVRGRAVLGDAEVARAVAELSKPPPEDRPLSARLEGLRLGLASGRSKPRGSFEKKLVRWWIAGGGPGFAVDVLLEGASWARESRVLERTVTVSYLGAPTSYHGGSDTEGMLELLREALAIADAAEYARALAAVEAGFERMSDHSAASFAFLFPSEGLAERAADRVSSSSWLVGLLQQSVRDIAVAERLLPDVLLTGTAPLVLLSRFGPAAEPLLWKRAAVEETFHARFHEAALVRIRSACVAARAAEVLLLDPAEKRADFYENSAERQALWKQVLERWPGGVAPHLEEARARPDTAALAERLLAELALTRSPEAPRGFSMPAAVRPSAPMPVMAATGAAMTLAELLRFAELLVRLEDAPPSPELRSALAAIDPVSLSAFAVSVGWASRSAKSPWVLPFLELVPSAEVARMIAGWADSDASIGGWFARATAELAVLDRMGTDDAIDGIQRLSEEARSTGLRARARAVIERVAAARGLSVPELVDTVVPAFGLGPDGRAPFFIGAERCSISVDAHLVPFLIDSQGVRLATFPEPGPDDDAAEHAAAQARFEALAKDLEAVLRAQALRLERAMVEQQRWSRARFDAAVRSHPLIALVASRLVWAVFERGAPGVFFRLDETRRPVGAADTELALPDGDIGLPHRVAMPDDMVDAFGKLFADYEILQPFQQLERAAHGPHDRDAIVARLEAARVRAGPLYGLTRRGFSKEPVESGFLVNLHRTDRGVALRLRLDPGLPVAGGGEKPRQRLTVVLEHGASPHPIALSEALHELEMLVEG